MALTDAATACARDFILSALPPGATPVLEIGWGLLVEPTGHLAEVLGRVPPDGTPHHLRASAAIEAALRAQAETVRAERPTYYFRYFLLSLAQQPPGGGAGRGPD